MSLAGRPPQRPAVTVDIDEIVVSGVTVADPGALGDRVRAGLARLVTERGLPDANARPSPAPIRLASPHDVAALAAGIAEAIWFDLRSTT